MPMRKKDRKKTETIEPKAPKVKKVCFYCESKTEPSYTDSAALRKFVSDRSKIVARARTGACSKHQRKIATHIKYARHLSLIPFIARV